MELRELLDQPQHLPTVPTLVRELMATFEKDDISLGEIARLIATDPGLSAKLLRLANSAYFRTPFGIGTVDHALKMLGVKMTRNLVIATGLTKAFKVAPGMDIHQFWRYSLATACIARWLSAYTHQDAELGFMVGLLHGIGQFAMRSVIAREMMRIDTTVHPLDARRAFAEREALGFDHAKVGAELAKQWRFPDVIAHAIGSVPDPLATRPPLPIACVVHLAAWRARAEAFGDGPEALKANYPDAVAKTLGLDRFWTPALLAENQVVTAPARAMPAVAELTAGLEELLT